MQRINKLVSNDSVFVHSSNEQMVSPKTLIRSIPSSPPGNEHVKVSQRKNPFVHLYKKFKPVKTQAQDTVSIHALELLALSNINALEYTNTYQEQLKFLSDTKLHLGHIAGIDAHECERSQAITSIAINLSTKFKERCIRPNLQEKALRVITRLLAPTELKNSHSSAFNHIKDSRSPLISQETRSIVVENLVHAFPLLDKKKKLSIVELTLDQFENKGITPASREKLLNFLAGEALTTQDPEQSPSKNTPNTDQVWRALCVIDSTIREPRNFTQLCDLEKNLKNLQENLHKLNAAKYKTTAPNVSPPASNELLTLTSEILDTLEELQANTTEGKRLGLPERLQAHRKERQHERTSHNWYIGSPAWIHSSRPNSNDS